MPPTGLSRDPRRAALEWQIENNRAAFDRTAQLPIELEHLRDFLFGLRATRPWQLIRLLRALKQRLTRRRNPDPLEVALARLSTAHEPPHPTPQALLDPDTDYPTWIATTETKLHATLLGPDPGQSPIEQRVVGADLAAGLANITAPFTALCTSQDRLAPDALRIAAAHLAAHPDTDLLYADLDHIDAEGQRHAPEFRPDWDPDLHLGRDLLTGLLVCRTALLHTPGILDDLPTDPLDTLSLRLADAARTGGIRHIPAVLCHRPQVPDRTIRHRAVSAHLGPDRVEQVTHGLRIRPLPPTPWPRVSIIIPTKDRADLLGPCLDGLLRHTAYTDLELIVIDNASTAADALALLTDAAADPRVRVLHSAASFNWSALNNLGAAHATGDVLVLMNNDTAILHPDWLNELVAHAMRPEIGAVGPMLLYPDGRVQHAGIAFDDHGSGRHLFRFRDPKEPGPLGMLGLVRRVKAVTGACLALRRELYTAAGGPNEAFAVSCNDVDLCLRLEAMGYANLWTPFAVVEHRELASRGADTSPDRRARAVEEVLRLRRDWAGGLFREPHINANLVIVDEKLWLRGA